MQDMGHTYTLKKYSLFSWNSNKTDFVLLGIINATTTWILIFIV